jgi:hypothetical protein
MAEVTAMTYRDDDRDLPPREASGTLVKRHVPELDYDQYLVDGVPVDPSTIKESAD